MKTILNLNALMLLIFIVNLQSTIINQSSYNLYAQDPQLFEHTWYFVNGELEGEAFFPTQNLIPDMVFLDDYINVGYNFCEGGTSFEEINYENDIFQILGDAFFLVDFCSYPQDENELILMQKHNFFYGDFQNSNIANNPFNYSIENVDNYFQLTVTNGNGDWAVYNNVLLSTTTFHQNSFTMYPNPANETLYISKTFDQFVQSSIYDLSGKLLQRNVVDATQTQIDVGQFKSGVYFVLTCPLCFFVFYKVLTNSIL